MCVIIAALINCQFFFMWSVHEQICNHFAMFVLSLMLNVCLIFFGIVCVFPILIIKTFSGVWHY